MKKKLLLFILPLFSSFYLIAQAPAITGTLKDSVENKSLENAVISVLRTKDTTLVSFTRADKAGHFQLNKIDTGNYLLLITYPRFADYLEPISVMGVTNLNNVFLTPKSKLLDEVVIRTGSAIRIKGDTTEFVADSFKVKEGATVEDLLKKLPGFTVNSKGEIVAQGKRVDKVLVDGEEFFGDDPTMATQNLSAKAVDKVQVFETKTEQQQLTGMSTGNEGKTVNIKLKENAKKGSFGKAYGGTDFNKYFDSKLIFNRFAGKKKIASYITRTNVNTGSLNWEDRQKLGIENDYEFDELNGYYFSFGGGDDFNDWNLRGLPNAWTVGGLFSNKWGEADKNNLNLSYRYNRLGTTNDGTTLTQNILPTGITYSNRYTQKTALNQQHTINGKYEWKIDSFATIKLTVTPTFRKSFTTGINNSEFIGSTLDTVNKSFNDYETATERIQLDNQLSYKQLFKKKNRQWQTVLRYGQTQDDNDGLNKTIINYYTSGVFNNADTLDQQKLFEGKSSTLGIKTTFTEPLSAYWMLVFDYAYNNNQSKSLRNTYEKNINGKYEDYVPDFSNNFSLDAFSHSSNALLRYMGKKIKLGLGSGISSVKLKLNDLDNLNLTNYNFLNFTPQAQLNFTPKTQMNIGINYRGTTRQPTINQLQPLRDNTDPLNEYVGNRDLKVGFTNSINLFFNQYKVLSQRWMGINFSVNFQNNAITQFNTIDLSTGKRTYYPVNVDGNYNWNLWSNYNKSMGEKKPTYGFGFNGNGGRYINFVNGKQATTNYYTANANLHFGLDIVDKFSFEIGPMVGYNYSRSSLSTFNNNYFTYGGNAEINVTLPFKIEIETNVRGDLRQKIDAFATNTNLVIWNGTISKKVFKKDTGKISFYANDILNDNKGLTRTINSTFVSDDRFQRISRYFLLKFEWSFTKNPGEQAK